ncbi:MAG: hypothetical protein HYY21_02430 [Candidatus Tectomicrobia bacterium]|nr:hypothetical protein [Candidatus Tectomicrobia bacterium]
MKRFIVSFVVGGVLGAIEFWAIQKAVLGFTIPAFMGGQIVAQGGYPQSLATPIGWAVHLGVSLAYAFLLVAVLLIPFSRSSAARAVAGLVIALLLGWVTTLLTSPAIAATISLLSGKGFPSSLPPLNTGLGAPFWIHLAFFATVWAVRSIMYATARKP